MASIGPQLPPHLQKRKRTPDEHDDGEESRRSPKATRRENRDEISLDESSDDEFGPRAPAPREASGPHRNPPIGPTRPAAPPTSDRGAARNPERPEIGPTRPPPTMGPTANNGDEIPLDDGSGSEPDIGPAAPPPARPSAPKRVLGPAPPPADLSERPETGPNSDSDDDDDDDEGWGPALPSQAGASSRSTGAGAGRFGPAFPPPEQPVGPARRDDWMVAPPTSSGYRAPDPTKLKSRKFASGRSVAGSDAKSGGISSMWTETPEEKMRRVTNAVLGREDPNAAGGGRGGGNALSSRYEAARGVDESRVRAYTEETRGRSLVEEHQALKQAGKLKKAATSTAAPLEGQETVEEEDDPSKRAFDREKDMAVGGRISGAQRRQLLNKAANFGDRFQKGNYL
ncbi:hypothetical protein B0T24DRAFT_516037 [Lasiosphaeria ovina]|uniref:DUF3752 domain-containing protein n=1 Tax=Lasiosphaeria ovina TaxID=92902 RepID=A0AAE0TWN8_9PEZI|nr:hypothetical protein B0T24DRAFT_516037 [Lasiosphaeria ovina]